jgi:hypothetical protein
MTNDEKELKNEETKEEQQTPNTQPFQQQNTSQVNTDTQINPQSNEINERGNIYQ